MALPVPMSREGLAAQSQVKGLTGCREPKQDRKEISLR